MDPLPTLADVEAAALRLDGVAVRTPLLANDVLDRHTQARVFLKAEPLQRTGSFKFRGAYNAIALSQAEGRRPVVAYSSGNHAQGVAAAAGLLGVPATVVMPSDAPAIKIANTKRFGAEVRLYDRYREVRERIGAEIAESQGAALIKPYDASATIAGQGTCGLEIVDQCQALGAQPDVALVCCGGGGLIAGIGLVLKAAYPGISLYSVEPEGFDDTARSLAAGERQANAAGATSVCDALLANMPGELTFALNRQQLAGGLAVNEPEVAAAMHVGFRELKLVIEPGGAVALAAVIARKLDIAGKTVIAVLSGGNVDQARFQQMLDSVQTPPIGD